MKYKFVKLTKKESKWWRQFFIWLLIGIVLIASMAVVFNSDIPEYIFDSNSDTAIVENIVESYHATHSYTEQDFFVCADMAIDVWNMVKTRGINAQITVGNIDDPEANFTEYNHAWVLAEVNPFEWLALETTGGYVVYATENENYYRGYSFDNPAEFKKYLDLIKEYNSEIEKINDLENEYYTCDINYEQMRTVYNQKYAGKSLSNEGIDARTELAEKLGECNRMVEEIDRENLLFSNIISEINGLLS